MLLHVPVNLHVALNGARIAANAKRPSFLHNQSRRGTLPETFHGSCDSRSTSSAVKVSWASQALVADQDETGLEEGHVKSRLVREEESPLPPHLTAPNQAP